jgi:acyl carrier protein/polyketide biosynthesis acyl carrier protein
LLPFERRGSVTREEVFAVIKANIYEIIAGAQGKEILETNSMRDFGGDSLEIVEVVSRSMKQLRIKVPRTELLGVSDLKGLLDLFEPAVIAKGQ